MIREYYSEAARAHARRMLGNSSHSRGADEVWDLVADAYDMGSANRNGAQPDPIDDDYHGWLGATYPAFNEDIPLDITKEQA